MDENVEFLNYIHQNSQMGQDTIKQLIGITKQEEYRKILQSQFDEYKNIFDTTEQKLKQCNRGAKSISVISKVSTYIMINVNTLTNKTPSHISEMLIQGSTMGIVDITKKLKEYPKADKEIIDLGNQLLQFEQRNIEELKKYL